MGYNNDIRKESMYFIFQQLSNLKIIKVKQNTKYLINKKI